MESKVFGIPLAVWFFLIGLGLIIGLPLLVSYQHEMAAIRKVDTDVLNSAKTIVVTPTVLPTATPSATPTVTLQRVPVRVVTVAPTK